MDGGGRRTELERLLAEAARLGVPGRDREFGVGKRMGSRTWMHRSCAGRLRGRGLEAALAALDPGVPWTAVRFDRADGSFAFIESADFDEAHEPTVGRVWAVSGGRLVRVTPPPADPLIWHHKFLWVEDGYRGFDVAGSVRRSIAWKSLVGRDAAVSSRIGRRSYWEAEVAARLTERAACEKAAGPRP